MNTPIQYHEMMVYKNVSKIEILLDFSSSKTSKTLWTFYLELDGLPGTFNLQKMKLANDECECECEWSSVHLA